VLYTPHGVFGDFVSLNLVPQNQDKIRTGGAGLRQQKKKNPVPSQYLDWLLLYYFDDVCMFMLLFH
jgi:hypothetical protein